MNLLIANSLGSSDLPTKLKTCTCNWHGSSRQVINLISLEFPTCTGNQLGDFCELFGTVKCLRTTEFNIKIVGNFTVSSCVLFRLQTSND